MHPPSAAGPRKAWTRGRSSEALECLLANPPHPCPPSPTQPPELSVHISYLRTQDVLPSFPEHTPAYSSSSISSLSSSSLSPSATFPDPLLPSPGTISQGPDLCLWTRFAVGPCVCGASSPTRLLPCGRGVRLVHLWVSCGNGTEQMLNQKPSKLQDAILTPVGCETVPEMFLTFRHEITLEGCWVLHQEPQIKDGTKPVELPLPLTLLRLAHIVWQVLC